MTNQEMFEKVVIDYAYKIGLREGMSIKDCLSLLIVDLAKYEARIYDLQKEIIRLEDRIKVLKG